MINRCEPDSDHSRIVLLILTAVEFAHPDIMQWVHAGTMRNVGQ